MNNYRTIELPDCCALCKYYVYDHDFGNICEIDSNNKYEYTDINGLCDKFEREE